MLGKIQILPCNPKYIGYDCGNIAIPNTEQWICNCISGKYKHAYNYIWLDEEGIKDLSQRIVFANSPKQQIISQ